MNKLWKEALKFILLFAVLFAASYLGLSVPFIEKFLAALAAYSAQFVLSLFGVQSAIEWRENPHVVGAGFDAELADLCWGKTELAVLFGVIFASLDRPLRKRALGFAGGVLLTLLFNPLRISVTLKLFDASRPFASAVVHDVLFRASLVVLIVSYYAFWYYWLSKERI